jgi:aminocarboxymuconate-semialdehyde decarboxylase
MVGITVGCSVAGRQLDDPAFVPFFAELDRGGTVLFLHPMGVGAGPATADYGLAWIVGAPVEDTVAALRLTLSGLTTRYPGIRIIVPHLGGTLPFLLRRLEHTAAQKAPAGAGASAGEPLRTQVGRFWFDTAASHPAAVRCTCECFGADRLLLGTDIPYGLVPDLHRSVEDIEAAGLSAVATAAILGDNAQALLGLR